MISISIIRNILVRVGADIAPLQRTMGQAQRTLGTFQNEMRITTGRTQSSMSTIANALNLGALAYIAFGVAAVAAMLKVGKESLKSAMDVVESENLFAISMGNMADTARAWSDDLQATLGLNAYEVRRNVGMFYNMTTSMGLTRDAAYKLSTDLTKLAYDMSSFYNMPVEEMFVKLQSGITGETEPLKRIGILVLDSTIKQYAYAAGIANVGSELTEQQKVMARYIAIMEQTKNSQGDLARTVNSPSNQLRLLRMQLQLANINLGNAFMPIVTIVLPILTEFAKRLVQVTNTFSQFMNAIFGTNKAQVQTAQTAAAASAAQTNLGNSAKKAGDKAKRGLAGFDQLNTLQEKLAESAGAADDAIGSDSVSTMPIPSNNDSGAGLVPAGVAGAAARTKASLNNLKQTAGEVAQFIKYAFGPPLLQAFSAMLPASQTWKAAMVSTFQALGTLGAPFMAWLTGGLVPLMQQVILTVGAVAAGMAGSLLLVFNSLRTAIFPILEWFVAQGLPFLTSFASGAVKVLKSFFDYAKFVFDTLWQGVVDPAMQLVSKLVLDCLKEIKGFWDKFGSDIVTGLVATFNTMKGLFSALWTSTLAPIVKGLTTELSWLWEKHLKGVVTELLNFIGKLITGAMQIYNGFIAPIAKYLIELFGPSFANAFTLVAGIIGTFLGTVADVAKGVLQVLGGITDFIAGVFTGNWAKAWGGVKEIFSGIFTSLGGIVKGAMNQIIDSINWMIRGLNKIHFETPDWVPGVGGESFGVNIPSIPKLAKGGIINAPTLAIMGEGRKREAVVPLENSSFIDSFAGTIASAVAQAMGPSRGNGGGDTTVVLKIGESEFGRAAIKSINSVHRQTGMTLLTI